MCWKKPNKEPQQINVQQKKPKKNMFNSCCGEPENWEDNDTIWGSNPQIRKPQIRKPQIKKPENTNLPNKIHP
tara:strand:- start:613 stop:831 length:219 start_codon:yes stop_codon:yes gene_type:complete